MTSKRNGKRAVSEPATVVDPQAASADTRIARLRPFRQGSLDSYCGFYAVANSIFKLKPDWFLSHDDAVYGLFYKMMKGATRSSTPVNLCAEGMDGNELKAVAKTAVRHMKKLGHRFELLWPEKALRHVPCGYQEIPLWLSAAAEDSSLSVILHIEERGYNHWSVLKSIKGNRVYLFDSDNMAFTHVNRCEPWIAIKVT